MMTIVADTSPLNYLLLIGEVEVLPKLYNHIVIPEAVFVELQARSTPAPVAEWIARRPRWLQVEPSAVPEGDRDAQTLGKGEREAIALAQAHLPSVVLLIDEGRGRRLATQRRIPIIGTLGVLDMAAARGLLHLPAALERLQQTSFHVAPGLIALLLDRDAARRTARGPVPD